MLLLEREAHLETIAAAITAARSGRGSVVLLEGPAGIGKSALLAAAQPPDDVRRLSARGGELERELPLAVARQLLEPPLIHADAARRERLLRSTGPVQAALEGSGTGDGDATALLHGLHRLTCNLADEAPLVIEVDDVHWADAGSLRFLCFLARRLDELPIAVLLARRTGESSIDETALEAIADDPLTERRVLKPLSAAGSARLIAGRNGGADARFASVCHAASAGNPFVLQELLRALAGAGVSFDAEAAERVRDAGLPAVGRWVLRRLGRLPAGATRLARSVAVLGPHADIGRSGRLADLSLDEAGLLLDALVAHDVLLAGRRLEFVHPVVRAAVHDAIPPGERSNTHRAAARLLREQRIAPDAVATHLLAAEPGGEGWVAEALLDGARLALSRGAPEVAAAQARRAFAEPAPSALTVELRRTLGSAERRLGLGSADEHFLAAYATSSDVRERAQILLDATITGASSIEMISRLRATMDQVVPVDPELALILRARLLVAMESAPDGLWAEVQAAEAALAAHRGGTFGARLIAGTLAMYRAMAGGRRGDVLDVARRALADDGDYAADLAAGFPHMYAIMALGLVDEFELAERRLTAAIDSAQERGSLIGIAIGRYNRAVVRRRTGRLALAHQDAGAAMQSAVGTADTGMIAATVAELAETLIELGLLDEARALLVEHQLDEAGLSPPAAAWLRLARGAVASAAGCPADAQAHAAAAGTIFEALDCMNPNGAPWRARAASALVALGRASEAAAIAGEALKIAEATEIPSAIGEAKRVLAGTMGGDAAIGLLRESVAVLEPSPASLELTRALLGLGAALRRAGRRREARDPLGRALELAHRSGAEPLVHAARAELRAAGARPRREVRTGIEALTPSERRVADLAASGLSNTQIAARLFITRKTTEHHLAATYRKLGISSRHQLGPVLDDH